MKSIYVLGSLNTDLVIESNRIPKAGETLTGNSFMINYGGKGANQAYACQKLGGKVYMAGCVGDDDFGKKMKENLSKCGVNVDAIRVIKGVSSGVAVITVVNGENRIILSAGANAMVSNDDVDNLLRKAKPDDIFVTQGETPFNVTLYGLEQAKKIGMVTVFNPAPADKEFYKAFKYVDILTPNETEAEILTGETDLTMVAKKLDVKTLVVTLGKKGYYLNANGCEASYDAIKVKVIDTTAAGDTFLGGTVAKLSLGDSLESALKFGSKAASIACTKKGAQQSIPTAKEVDNYLENS